MGTFRQILKNFTWSLSAELTQKVFFIFATIYLARKLGVEGYGIFIFAQTVVLNLAIAVDLGTNMYGVREIAISRGHHQRIIAPIASLRLYGGLFVTFWLIIVVLASSLPMVEKLTLLASGTYLLWNALQMEWVAKGLERFDLLIYPKLLSSFIFIVGIFIFVSKEADVVMAAIIWSFAFLAQFFILALILNNVKDIRIKYTKNLRECWTHLKKSSQFMIAGIISIFYTSFPVFFIRYEFDNYSVGMFSAPFRIVIASTLFAFMLRMAIYPTLSKLFQNDITNMLRTHNTIAAIVFFAGGAVSIFCLIFASDIIILLFGESYKQSVSVFVIVLWLIPLMFTRYVNSLLFAVSDKQYLQIYAAFIGLGVLIALSVALLPRFGLKGVGYSLIGAECIFNLSIILFANLFIYNKIDMVKDNI